jgi:HTH-type transcriptional regulator, sugar sensing transcriptional regulator
MSISHNPNIIKELEKSGLSEKAARVYNCLLELGGAYPSKIAEQTHLNRSTVYKILVDLSVKGLVTEVDKDKKLFYQIEKPYRLLRYAQQRSETAQDQYERVKELIPELEGFYSNIANKPKIRFFENREGIMSIYEDHLNVKKPYEMLGFANATELEKALTTEFIRKYAKQKEKKNITTRGILPDSPTDRSYNKRMYTGIRKDIWLNLRYIPKEEFPFKGEIIVYGEDRLSITNFDEHRLMGLIIEDKAIHDMMTRIFELAWKGAAKPSKK